MIFFGQKRLCYINVQCAWRYFCVNRNLRALLGLYFLSFSLVCYRSYYLSLNEQSPDSIHLFSEDSRSVELYSGPGIVFTMLYSCV